MSWKTHRVMTWLLLGAVILLFWWDLALTAALPDDPPKRSTNWCESMESIERFQEEYPSLGLYCH